MTTTTAELVLPSPVQGAITVVENEGGRAVTQVRIDPSEQVFAGHYPGFPIFPGVCIVECVLRSASAAPAAPGLRLAVVESTRFQTPVFPGDTLTIDLAWSQDGADWRCRAEVRTDRDAAAQVRVRYQPEETGC